VGVPAAVQARWVRRAKPMLFLLGLAPFAWLLFRVFTGRLSPEPVEDITFATGDWGLRFLLITLAVTPLRALSGFNALIRLRRMLGLFAFFYLCLHFATYLVLDQFFDWSAIVEDIAKRTYILVGLTGFVLLIPLAVTSTDAMMKRLGGRRWKRLHKLVYVTAVAGVVHFLWLVKADISEPMIYIAILVILLGYRIYANARTRSAPSPRAQLAAGR
jgi:sulfoxide reductase heme-binding subunit YedZ